MSAYILVNDQYFLASEAVLQASNRAFKYADAIFETMRMKNGKLLLAGFHAERIRQAMILLKMDGYNLLDEYFLKQKTTELARKNKLAHHLRFRLTIYRAGEGLYAPIINKVAYVLEVSSLDTPAYEYNSKGLLLGVYEEVPKAVNILSNCKTTQALPFVMAAIYQKQRRLDDVVLLNQHGFLCESTSSNIFVVYQGQIYTPALSEGCVAGVMRKRILQLAELHGKQIVEAQINPKILIEADEIFLTNAIHGVRWVMGYGRKRYFNQVSREVSDWLNQSLHHPDH